MLVPKDIKGTSLLAHKVGTFFKSQNFKECLTFSLFIIASLIFWLVQRSREVYENIVEIPIEYVNLPEGYVFIKVPPDAFRVRVQDQGSNLFWYQKNAFAPIIIDMQKQINMNKTEQLSISSQVYEQAIRKQFKITTKVINISPDVLQLTYDKEEGKEVPVSLEADIEYQNQYCLTGEIAIIPDRVMAYGAQNILDSIQEISTIMVEQTNVKDSLKLTVSLQELDGIRFVPDQVNVMIPVGSFTENSVDLPLTRLNFPSNLRLITFPSVIRLTYCVSLEHYTKIKKEEFLLTIDYQKLKDSGFNRMYRVDIASYPKEVFNVRISPEEVECLIEENPIHKETEKEEADV